ncbi:hypothetical protein HK102_011533, partial [Quaeritorhiza haematococci]
MLVSVEDLAGEWAGRWLVPFVMGGGGAGAVAAGKRVVQTLGGCEDWVRTCRFLIDALRESCAAVAGTGVSVTGSDQAQLQQQGTRSSNSSPLMDAVIAETVRCVVSARLAVARDLVLLLIVVVAVGGATGSNGGNAGISAQQSHQHQQAVAVLSEALDVYHSLRTLEYIGGERVLSRGGSAGRLTAGGDSTADDVADSLGALKVSGGVGKLKSSNGIGGGAPVVESLLVYLVRDYILDVDFSAGMTNEAIASGVETPGGMIPSRILSAAGQFMDRTGILTPKSNATPSSSSPPSSAPPRGTTTMMMQPHHNQHSQHHLHQQHPSKSFATLLLKLLVHGHLHVLR